MKIPIGATHIGLCSRNYYKVVDGVVYVYNTIHSSWRLDRQARSLLDGSGVKTTRRRSNSGYYKLTLEEIMDSFIGDVK
jgi:hypothetical protein